MTDVSAENKPEQTVRLRYFAAVAEAAGVSEESVSIVWGSTSEQLRTLLVESHGAEFARVLGVSALLAEGAITTTATPSSPSITRPTQMRARW